MVTWWDKIIKWAALGLGAIAGLYGEWTTALQILCILMVVDYITGVLVAISGKSPKTDGGGNCYVRTVPSTGCEAIGVAYEDSKWPFAGLVNDENGWLMIDYKGKDGWVSPKYGRLVE